MIVTTDRGVALELGDTCFATWDGERITGAVTLRIDDAGGILAQGSPGSLQGVIRLVVDAPAVAGRFVALERPMKVRVELDDGTLPGDWEAVAWVDGDTYAAGPATQGTRPEVGVTLVPIRHDGPEEFEYWGSGPIGIRYVRPPAASAAAAAISRLGAGTNVVTINLLQAGLSPDFPTTFPFLCDWRVIAAQTGEYLELELPENLPHGQSSVTSDYMATVRTVGAPTFEVASPYFNRVILVGSVCDDAELGLVGGSQLFANHGHGGSPEEAHLPGPYDGRMILLFGGQDPTIFDDVLEMLPTAFPPPMRAVIRRFVVGPRGSDADFELLVDIFHHPESVRRIASVFPPHWRYEFDDRYAVVNSTPSTTSTIPSTTTTTLPGPPEHVDVQVGAGCSLSPSSVTIASVGSVKWINNSPASVTMRGEDDNGHFFDSGNFGPDEELTSGFSRSFNGAFVNYTCLGGGAEGGSGDSGTINIAPD